jgi:putative phosphoribosyl transferase
MVFEDRRHAGRELAAQLLPLAGERPIVLGLPRGGVPVALEVARALKAPLDVLTVRKLGAPQNPELAVGAVAEDGTAVLNLALAGSLGMTQAQLDRVIDQEGRELRRRMKRFRDGWEPADVRGRTVIVVDDGLATGMSDLAAVRALRGRGAERIVVAAPVGSREAISMLGEEADEVICHTIPRDLLGVGHWYKDFSPVSDEEVLALLAEAGTPVPEAGEDSREVALALGDALVRGDLAVPAGAKGLVIFAHGSGSSRHSSRNRAVAATLRQAGLGTLLLDLLTDQEEGRRELVFDIPLLARRLELATRWAIAESQTVGLSIGYFGASTGAAAALRAAAAAGEVVRAVVSRGGRPDLAADRLPHVAAPTLLIVGSLDEEVLELNRHAASMLRCEHRLAVVDGASHLFEEPGTLDAAAKLAADWFGTHLTASSGRIAAAGG